MKNNKGFAISGMIYPILILSIFLIVELLVTLQSRKLILDKNKNDLLNDINNGQTYKKYANGEAIYFNPETNTKCNDYTETNSQNENKSGCMKWYAFNDSEDSDKVNVILDHNTTYSVAWNSSGNNADGMKEVKEALENDTRSWDIKLNPRLIKANEIAKITGNTEFDATINGKDIYFYFENNSQDRPQLSQSQAKYKWLFDYTNDCTSYGCSIADKGTYGYWTSNAAVSLSRNAWHVVRTGGLHGNSIDDIKSDGVRPVITIEKSILEKPIKDTNLVNTIKDKNTANNNEGLFTDDFGNIRYGGKTVKNYVTFNNESWRMIGIFDNKMKLIRETSLPKQLWSSGYNNDWKAAFLNVYLNGIYYNGLTEKAKSMIEESTFISGGSNEVLLTRKELYQKEHSTGTSDIQNVGLMNASDYMYATGSACSGLNAGDFENKNCTDANWMYRNVGEWTQSVNTGISTLVWSVQSDGSIAFTNMGQYLDARPVVYLKNNVKIKSGTGTQSDPYIIE